MNDVRRQRAERRESGCGCAGTWRGGSASHPVKKSFARRKSWYPQFSRRCDATVFFTAPCDRFRGSMHMAHRREQ
jgi:hypothetical protein